MLEALGLLGGALVRFAPLLLNFLKEGRDLKYEGIRLDKEIELERLRGANKDREIAAMTSQAVDMAWAQGLVEAVKTQTVVTGDKWLDRINISVRPILTYWWCLVLYTKYKLLVIGVALHQKLPAAELVNLVATDFDRAVIASIIGYWFLDRSLRKELK